MTLFDPENTALTCQIPLEEVFNAYYECRRNKRRTVNALAFELNFEHELIRLWQEINTNKYKIGRSIAFVIKHPVQREVFAANFRDRIVHHLVISKINHLFEEEFIPTSYSCREGKGVLYGVKNIKAQMKDCSENYTKDCYILKLDIRSFFMSINKNILYQRLHMFISEKYHQPDKPILLRLIKQIIFYAPEDNCTIKGKWADWNGLPCYKSLFWSEGHCGLPIGNLTSQIFANFYLNSLDKYITQTLGIKHYGRYVDDFILMHQNKQTLIEAHNKIKNFISSDLKLHLHPQKVYLQHYSKGVKFIGSVIKPHCIYIGKRSKNNLYNKIYSLLPQMANSVQNTLDLLQHFTSSINSYMGFMRHYNTYNLRCKITNLLETTFLGNILLQTPNALKIAIHKNFTAKELKKRQLRRQKQYRKKLKKHLQENIYGLV